MSKHDTAAGPPPPSSYEMLLLCLLLLCLLLAAAAAAAVDDNGCDAGAVAALADAAVAATHDAIYLIFSVPIREFKTLNPFQLFLFSKASFCSRCQRPRPSSSRHAPLQRASMADVWLILSQEMLRTLEDMQALSSLLSKSLNPIKQTVALLNQPPCRRLCVLADERGRGNQ